MNKEPKRPTIKVLRKKCPYCINRGTLGYLCMWQARIIADDYKDKNLSVRTTNHCGYKCEGCQFVYAITNTQPTQKERKDLFMVERRYQRHIQEWRESGIVIQTFGATECCFTNSKILTKLKY